MLDELKGKVDAAIVEAHANLSSDHFDQIEEILKAILNKQILEQFEKNPDYIFLLGLLVDTADTLKNHLAYLVPISDLELFEVQTFVRSYIKNKLNFKNTIDAKLERKSKIYQLQQEIKSLKDSLSIETLRASQLQEQNKALELSSSQLEQVNIENKTLKSQLGQFYTKAEVERIKFENEQLKSELESTHLAMSQLPTHDETQQLKAQITELQLELQHSRMEKEQMVHQPSAEPRQANLSISLPKDSYVGHIKELTRVVLIRKLHNKSRGFYGLHLVFSIPEFRDEFLQAFVQFMLESERAKHNNKDLIAAANIYQGIRFEPLFGNIISVEFNYDPAIEFNPGLLHCIRDIYGNGYDDGSYLLSLIVELFNTKQAVQEFLDPYDRNSTLEGVRFSVKPIEFKDILKRLEHDAAKGNTNAQKIIDNYLVQTIAEPKKPLNLGLAGNPNLMFEPRRAPAANPYAISLPERSRMGKLLTASIQSITKIISSGDFTTVYFDFKTVEDMNAFIVLYAHRVDILKPNAAKIFMGIRFQPENNRKRLRVSDLSGSFLQKMADFTNTEQFKGDSGKYILAILHELFDLSDVDEHFVDYQVDLANDEKNKVFLREHAKEKITFRSILDKVQQAFQAGKPEAVNLVNEYLVTGYAVNDHGLKTRGGL